MSICFVGYSILLWLPRPTQVLVIEYPFDVQKYQIVTIITSTCPLQDLSQYISLIFEQ